METPGDFFKLGENYIGKGEKASGFISEVKKGKGRNEKKKPAAKKGGACKIQRDATRFEAKPWMVYLLLQGVSNPFFNSKILLPAPPPPNPTHTPDTVKRSSQENSVASGLKVTLFYFVLAHSVGYKWL